MQYQNFEDLLEANKDRIYRICKIYAIVPFEPQDLFQEVVFQTWKSFGSFKNKSHIDTWVYRITLNVCMRFKLKLEKSNAHTIRYESIKFRIADRPINEKDDEKYVALKECIATLNESDTSIIVLYLEDLPYKEIASITGLTENHVAVKMKRIRKRLYDCLKPKLN